MLPVSYKFSLCTSPFCQNRSSKTLARVRELRLSICSYSDNPEYLLPNNRRKLLVMLAFPVGHSKILLIAGKRILKECLCLSSVTKHDITIFLGNRYVQLIKKKNKITITSIKNEYFFRFFFQMLAITLYLQSAEQNFIFFNDGCIRKLNNSVRLHVKIFTSDN